MTGQRTFKLVPETLVKSSVQYRPVTSKAAKAAYKKATSGPKISRAEQRRREAEELAQQKKEYERERNAAKAKAARDKKALKEQQEKDNRKRLGLPEPNRFVRASQPTIKGFVKVEPTGKRTWKDMNDVNDGDNAQDSYRRGRGDTVDQDLPPAKVVAVSLEAEDDDFGDFPSLSQNDFTFLDLPTGTCPVAKDDKNGVSVEQRCADNAEQPSKSTCPVKREPSFEDEELDSLVTSQLLSEMSALVQNSMPIQGLPRSLSTSTISTGTTHERDRPLQAPPTLNNSSKKGFVTARYPVTKPSPQSIAFQRTHTVNSAPPRKPLGKISENMPPPPRPYSANTDEVRKQACSLNAELSSAVPPSTLAFLEAHMEDFFPSPSQQVRELLDDVSDFDMPTNTQVARELDSEPVLITPQPTLCQIKLVPRPSDMHPFPIQKRIGAQVYVPQKHAVHQGRPAPVSVRYSPQARQAHQATSVDKPTLNALQNTRKPEQIPAASPSRACRSTSAPQPDLIEDIFSFLSSQELEITSEDLRDIDSPSKTAVYHLADPQGSTKDIFTTETKAQHSNPKPRFFEEKEEDLLQAALHESLVMSKRPVSKDERKEFVKDMPMPKADNVRPSEIDFDDDKLRLEDDEFFDYPEEFLKMVSAAEHDSDPWNSGSWIEDCVTSSAFVNGRVAERMKMK